MEKTTLQPVTAVERYISLDVLRGFAILGILIMNIQSFSLPSAAYMNPMAYGDMTGINKWVWIISHLVANTKFISIFSMLFGAGLILFYEKAKEKGRKPAAFHYRRMFWLLLFGFVHAYLIWYGDILVAYALCGMLVYLFRNAGKRWLIIASALFFIVPVVTIMGSGATVQYWPEESYNQNLQTWLPSQERINEQINAVRGGFMEQLKERMEMAIFLQTFVFFYSMMWRVISMMLLGMWLYRSGVLTLKKSNAFYTRMVIIGLGAGYPIVAWGIYENFAAGWKMDFSMFFGEMFNYFGSVLVALGYIGIIMLICKSNGWKRFKDWMSAVGRMAFSNYILQSVICTVIFTGFGFALFGRVERIYQILIVFAVWVMVIVFSKVWMKHYRFGPLEWLWRTLTYWKKQGMKREDTAA
jgi:uncharacterized protein